MNCDMALPFACCLHLLLLLVKAITVHAYMYKVFCIYDGLQYSRMTLCRVVKMFMCKLHAYISYNILSL